MSYSTMKLVKVEINLNAQSTVEYKQPVIRNRLQTSRQDFCNVVMSQRYSHRPRHGCNLMGVACSVLWELTNQSRWGLKETGP